MKIHSLILASALAAPLAASAQFTTIFSDNFTGGSTITNTTPVLPTATSTSYEEISGSVSWTPSKPSITNGLLFGTSASGGADGEVQALFASSPVQLNNPGDSLQLTVTFTNVMGLLTQDSQFGIGIYNSAGSFPVAGGLNNNARNNNTGFSTGGAQNWNGYLAEIAYPASLGGSKSSEIVSRPPQTGPGNNNQVTVVPGKFSSIYGFDNPDGTVVGSASSSSNVALVTGGTYTEVVNFTLQASNTLQITANLYANNTAGALLTSLNETTTSAPVTNAFDAFSVGWRSSTSGGTPTEIDISSIQVATYIPSLATCVSASVSTTSTVIGETNQFVTVNIPTNATATGPLSVDIDSTNPAVAYPTGAPGGTLTVTFPQNAPYFSTNLSVTAVGTGTTLFYITNAVPATCISTNFGGPLTVTCGTVTLTPVTVSPAIGQTNQTVTIALTSGMNQSGDVSVTISNSNPSVATPQFTTVTFPQGGQSSTNININALSIGTTTLSLTGLTGSCGSVSGTSLITVNCDPVTISPNALVSLVGQTSQIITVSIPAYANLNGSVTVDLKSLNPSVAVAQGATGDTLTLTFPEGTTNAQAVTLDVLTTGTATLVLTNGSDTTGCVSTLTNAALLVTVPSTDETTNKTENFDSAAEAMTNGWTDFNDRANGQNYGFSDTSYVQQSTNGEAGGSFVRYTSRSYYADTTIGTLTLNDYISASGQLFINQPSTDATFNIGYFNTHDPNGNIDILGIALADGTPPGQRISIELYPSDGLTVSANDHENFGPVPVTADETYNWSFTYDPTAGASGSGQLVLAYGFNGSPFTTNIDITPAIRAAGGTFNAFGMLVRATGSLDTNTPMGLFMDGVTYTRNAVVIPAAIPLLFQSASNQLTFTWSNPAFSLAVATNVAGPYVKISASASPFITNTSSGTGFFRLVYP